MNNPEAAGVGVLLGLLYGLVLAASLDSLGFASWVLYRNMYTIPLATSLTTAFLSLATVLTYPWWIERAQNAIVKIAEASYGEDELDEESWRHKE